MNNIPQVPTSDVFKGRKKLDGRKARRKRYTIEVLPARMAKGRDPRKNFKRRMYAERQPIMGDRLSTDEQALWLLERR